MSEGKTSVLIEGQEVEAFTREELQALKAKALRLAVGASTYDGELNNLTALASAASTLETFITMQERRAEVEAEAAAMRACEKKQDG